MYSHTRYLYCWMFRSRYYSCRRRIYFYDLLFYVMINRCCDHVIDDDSFDVLVSLFCYVRLLVWLALVNWCWFPCNALMARHPLNPNFGDDVMVILYWWLAFCAGYHAICMLHSHETTLNSYRNWRFV